MDQGCARAPEETANNRMAEAPSGPIRCRATGRPKKRLHSQTLNRVPRETPMAARLHSMGRVFVAAGKRRLIQRIGMVENVRESQAAGQKRAWRGTRQALELFLHGGRDRRSLTRADTIRKFIIMRVECNSFDVWFSWPGPVVSLPVCQAPGHERHCSTIDVPEIHAGRRWGSLNL